jgi:hypothetical protein
MSAFRRVVLAVLFACPVARASAQGTPIAIPEPIDLEGRVNLWNTDEFRGGQKKILIPTVLVRFATRGSLTVVNQGRFFESGGGTAKAKGKFVVAGLEKAYVQGIARQLQDDLVARLRAVGHTVLTFDDVRANEEVVKMGRYRDNADYGMPTGSPRGMPNDYVMAFPTDEQAIDPPFQGYGWGFRKVAKELDVMVIVPEYTIDAPLLGGSRRNGYGSRGASVGVTPDMMLMNNTPFWTPKMKGGSFALKAPIMELADSVGVIGDATDDSPRTANAIATGLAQLSPLGANLQSRSGTWGMRIDPALYSAAVLRGAVSVNMAIEKAARDEFAKR